MKSCGVIITYMDWSKWKTWWFNIPLMLFQLTFMVVGKIIGKVDTPLRRVWRAAQASHVRLVLEKVDDNILTVINAYWTANFGYPKMEIQPWSEIWNDGKRFEYRDPTFTFSQDRIDNMIQYANDQVGLKYDWLQLLSPPANFPLWVFYWPWWGKEIIRWFNLRGGREYCSSGAVATLLWFAESRQVNGNNYLRIMDGNKSGFFGTYDPAMVMPCMFVISEKWKPESNIVIQKRIFDRLIEETTGVPDCLRGEHKNGGKA